MVEKRALLIDDNEQVLHRFSLILAREGYWVATAINVMSGFEKFYQRPFDLVVTSLAMKTGKGFTVLGMVKALSPLTPVIVFTRSGCSVAHPFLPLLGTCAFINWPCSEEALVSCIKNPRVNGGAAIGQLSVSLPDGSCSP